MTNEEILANAPDGATHVDEEGFFWILEFNRRVCFGTTSERKATNSYVYRSLSDIRRIVELEQCLVEVTNGATGQSPCAKYCEARATEIEMRKLRAENDRLYNALAKFEGVEQEISALKHESNRKSQRIENVQRRKAEYKKRAETAERERDDFKRVAVDAATESFLIAADNDIKRVLAQDNKSASAINHCQQQIHRVARSCAIDCINNQLRQQLNGGE